MGRFSPEGDRIAVGSDDACVDIYSTANLTRLGYCRPIPSYVTHLDWSQDGKYLQVSRAGGVATTWQGSCHFMAG